MAELNVQPKKRNPNSFLPWLLLALGVIALVFFITRNGERYEDDARPVAGTNATTYTTTSENAARGKWEEIDFNSAPKASFNEIKHNEVEVRGGGNYAIYSIDRDALFGKDMQLKKNADQILSEVVKSINTRFNNGEVRLFGKSDTQNDLAKNNHIREMELIRNWFNQNGLPQISLYSMDSKNDNETVKIGDDDEVKIVAMPANK
jgi:hypothetical protein